MLLVYNGGSALVARLLGVKVYEFALGIGPCLVRRTWAGTEYRLNALPISSYVRMEVGEDADAPRTSPEPPGILFSELNPWLAWIPFVAGPASAFVLAGLLLGWPQAWASFRATHGQILPFLLEPFSSTTRYAPDALVLLSTGTVSAWLGTLSAKIAAMNLLPLPPLNGFHVLKILVLGHRAPDHRAPDWLLWALNAGAFLLFGALLLGIFTMWFAWRAM